MTTIAGNALLARAATGDMLLAYSTPLLLAAALELLHIVQEPHDKRASFVDCLVMASADFMIPGKSLALMRSFRRMVPLCLAMENHKQHDVAGVHSDQAASVLRYLKLATSDKGKAGAAWHRVVVLHRESVVIVSAHHRACTHSRGVPQSAHPSVRRLSMRGDTLPHVRRWPVQYVAKRAATR